MLKCSGNVYRLTVPSLFAMFFRAAVAATRPMRTDGVRMMMQTVQMRNMQGIVLMMEQGVQIVVTQ